MAGRKVFVTLAEQAAILAAEEYFSESTGKQHRDWGKALRSLAAKVEKAQATPAKQAFNWVAFKSVAQEVLGPRLVLPVSTTAGWMAQVNRALDTAGLTAATAKAACEAAGRQWTGRIRLESIARQASVLLAVEADRMFPSDAEKAEPEKMVYRGPLELEED